MKLTKEHTKRIDSFLERLGCQYIDIRFEMVDHIASEIEDKVDDIPHFFEKNKFETPFLRYMISKNEEFQNRYAKLTKAANFKNIKQVLKLSLVQLTKIKTISLLLLTSLIYFVFLKQLDLKIAAYSSYVIIILVFVIGSIITYKSYKKYESFHKSRIYYLIYSITPIMLFNFNLLKNIEESFTFIIVSHFIGIILTVIITNTFLDDQKHFRKKYNHLLA